MRGYVDLNRAAFACITETYEKKGLRVFNPCRDGLPDGRPLTEYAATDLDALIRSHAITMLPGWSASKGAQAEHAVAQWLEIPITYPGSEGR